MRLQLHEDNATMQSVSLESSPFEHKTYPAEFFAETEIVQVHCDLLRFICIQLRAFLREDRPMKYCMLFAIEVMMTIIVIIISPSFFLPCCFVFFFPFRVIN
jgi:hypothetical protein